MSTQPISTPTAPSAPSADVPVEAGSASFQTAQVVTIASGHFVHDTFSAFIAPLLPLLQERLGIGYAVAGGLAVYAQLPSLLNPFIGYLADRVSLRYFIILAPGITATFMSAMGLAPSYLVLTVLMLLAGISIAAFHAPAPAMIGRLAGGRVGMGMSVFMASGELGRTLGPIFVVAGVGWFGLEGIWRLAIVGWLMSAILYWRLHAVSARPAAQRESSLDHFKITARQIFPVLSWLMLGRACLLASLTIYLPTFMSDVHNSSLWLAAASLTFLEAAGVVGALGTGTLSDRWGRGRVLTFLLSMSPVLMLLFLYAPASLLVPLLVALGLTAISPTPVLMATVQDHFPDNRALANGTFLALNFLIRALGIWVVGLLADNVGLPNAYLWSALIAFASLPAVWRLPQSHRR